MISGERKSAHKETKEGYYRVERVDADSISANFDRGVLEGQVPKPEQRKPRKVEISVGASQPTIEASEAPADES
jgi:HSP20 family protein